MLGNAVRYADRVLRPSSVPPPRLGAPDLPPHAGRVSNTRAGLTLVGTLLVAVVPVTEFFLWDALTARVGEVVYLQGSQEFDAETVRHGVKGRERQPCSDTDALYYRIDADVFAQLWSLFHGHAFFLPDYLAAAVLYETNRRAITSYSLRFRGLIRYLNVYPHLFAVSCHGVAGG